MIMDLKIYSPTNQEQGTVQLPQQFSEPVRPDVIKRAVLAIEANARQPYGAKAEAGKRHSAKLSRRRHKYRTSYGYGISRVPRKILSRRGTQMYWVGAVAPGTVGGRQAHPPKPEKDWSHKLNAKENRLAIRSALSATVVADLVKRHGYAVPDNYPFIVSDELEKIDKTKDAVAMLRALGFEKELERAKVKKVRAGKGKMRGRVYRKKTSLLIVVSKNSRLRKAAENIPGVEVCHVAELNAAVLAPGAMPGRATLYSQAAIRLLSESGLFTPAYKGKTVKKEKEKKTKKKGKAREEKKARGEEKTKVEKKKKKKAATTANQEEKKEKQQKKEETQQRKEEKQEKETNKETQEEE